MIEQTPRRTHKHRDVQSEEHTFAAKPPRAGHHADGADVQRRDRQGDAHARKRTRQLPNTNEAHKSDDANERRQRRKQRYRNCGNQDNRSGNCLRQVTPGLPRRPTRGMIVASGPRGKDSGKNRTIS